MMHASRFGVRPGRTLKVVVNQNSLVKRLRLMPQQGEPFPLLMLLNVMQVDLIDLICYSRDASCPFHVRLRTSVLGHASDGIIGANHQHAEISSTTSPTVACISQIDDSPNLDQMISRPRGFNKEEDSFFNVAVF
jgi:hypothetical protein